MTWNSGLALLVVTGVLALSQLSCNHASTDMESWSYEALVEVCGLQVDTPGTSPHTAEGLLEEPVSEECAKAVADSFGLDWLSFDDEPYEFRYAKTPSQIVIAAILTVMGRNNATVGDVIDGPGPQALMEKLRTIQEWERIDSTADAGWIWYRFLNRYIDRIEYQPGNFTGMAYYDGTVYVGDITCDVEWCLFPVDVGWAAGMLVHEAAHAIYPDHIECGGTYFCSQCDANKEGAYGSGSWWYYQWLKASIGYLDESFCFDMQEDAFYSCECINDKEQYIACSWNTLEDFFWSCHDEQ